MIFVRALVGGLLGALIGAGIWAAVAYFLNLNSGIIAWGVGALAGFGALKLTTEAGNTAGAAAVLAAVLGVAGGKFATASIAVHHFTSTIAQISPSTYTDDDLAMILAEKELDRIESIGRTHTLQWPKGKDRESAESIEDYPLVVANAARKDLKSKSPAELDAMRASIVAELNTLIAAQSDVTWAAFWDMFTIFDVLWFVLAAVTAWKIGAQDDTE